MKRTILGLLGVLAGIVVVAQTEKTVSNAAELVRAIGPDRTIILNAGVYRLEEAMDFTGDYVAWNEQYDGKELLIAGVSNMTLKAKGKASILARPQYVWVALFAQCHHIKIIGLTAGHIEKGYCTGGVFGFDNCTDVQIENCDMYGSGTEGISATDCKNFKISASKIHDCSYDLISLYSCADFSFTKCSFSKTGEFDLVYLSSCQNISFDKCIFSENFNGDFMPYLFNLEDPVNISLTGCKIINNSVVKFVNDRRPLSMKKNKFSGNTFTDFTDDFLNKNQTK